MIQSLASHLAPMTVTCHGPLLVCSLQRLELLTGQGCDSPITLSPHYSDSSQMPFTVPRSGSTLHQRSVNAKEDKASRKEMPNTHLSEPPILPHFAPGIHSNRSLWHHPHPGPVPSPKPQGEAPVTKTPWSNASCSRQHP